MAVMPNSSVQAPGRPDLLLSAVTASLVAFGALMIYSASFVVAHNEFDDDLYFLSRQLVGIGIGTVGLIAAARIDYRHWRKLSLIAMIVCIILLILVLVPGIGSRSYGAVRWLRLGPIQFQPSELAKLALVLYLADWLARRGSAIRQFSRGSVPFVIIVGIVASLVEGQPDLGTTSVIVGTAVAVFFLAGAHPRDIGLFVVGGVVGGAILLGQLSGYRADRIEAFFDPWSDLQGSGWHTAQTLIALGSGGTTGVGLGGSLQKFYWIPNAHTDAIFAIVGEELGLVGTLTMLALFGLLTWRGFAIAWRAQDQYGRLLAAGLTSALSIQALVNIAVVTNAIPFTGVTLPLVSYGNSSIVVSMVAVGLILSVSRYTGPRNGSDSERESPSPDQAERVAVPVAGRGVVRSGVAGRTPAWVQPSHPASSSSRWVRDRAGRRNAAIRRSWSQRDRR